MANYPCNGLLDPTTIPTKTVQVSKFKTMKKTEKENWLKQTNLVWVVDQEPANDFYPGLDRSTGLVAFSQRSIGHEPITEKNLFPARPSLDDIKQAHIADCWLLGCIAAILRLPGGPELLASTMVVDPKDPKWVTVLLYDKDGIYPRYIRMKKTMVRHKIGLFTKESARKTLHSVGAGKWVPILEKAATLFTKLQGSPFSPDCMSYLNCVYGNPGHAFEMLLGGASDFTSLRDSEVDKRGNDYLHLLCLLTIPSENVDQFSALVYWNNHDYLKDVFPDPNTFQAFLRETQGKGDSIVQALEDLLGEKYLLVRGAKSPVRGSLRDEDFTHLILYDSGIKSKSVQDAILKWVKIKNIFPGKRGSGTYTSKQLEQFRTIQDLLAADKPVCLATEALIARRTDSTGHSGGEQTAKGLVGGHAYAAFDTRVENQERYVLVHNPWGREGRVYSPETGSGGEVLTPRLDPEGLFWLDLSDLTKRFSSIFSTRNPPQPPVLGQVERGQLTQPEKTPAKDSAPLPHSDVMLQLPHTYLCDANLQKISVTALATLVKTRGSGLKPEDVKVDFSWKLPDDRYRQEKNEGTGKLEYVVEHIEPARQDEWSNYADKALSYLQQAKVSPFPKGILTLDKWKELSMVKRGSRKRILKVDDAVARYIAVFQAINPKDKTKTPKDPFQVKMLHLISVLGSLYMETSTYLHSYLDSDRREAVKKLEYLVVCELARLDGLYSFLQTDIVTSPWRSAPSDKIFNDRTGGNYLHEKVPTLSVFS